MANVINVLGSFPIDGPEEIYDILLSTTSVQQQSATHFVLITSYNGGTVTVDVTGTGFTFSNGQVTGGSYTKSVILSNGVPVIEFNYSPAISIAALNAGLATYDNSGSTAALDALYAAQPTTLNGTSGADTLFGLDGVDIFNGGGGVDLLNGRGGNDTYNLGADNDTVQDSSGIDTITTTISRNLTDYPTIENLTLLGASPISGTGNDLANTLDGSTNSAANVLTGLGNNDIYIVGAGDTVVEASNGGTDTVQSAVSHTLAANVENVTLLGSAAVNAAGNAAANILNGELNTAANTLYGLGGNDLLIVGAGDTVVEAAGAGGGTDTVRSSKISLNLANYANVENITLAGVLALNATGNSAANVITGNAVANTLNGGGGADTLIGLAGNDIYITDGGDTIIEAANAGTDTVQSSVSHTLAVNVENLTLTGSIAINGAGNTANNILNGATNSAANVLYGFAGNDTFILGVGDSIVEAAGAGGGIDTVQSAVVSLSLVNHANAENATLLGTLGLTAGGNSGANVLIGNAGNNTLFGGLGNDTMTGGAGSDIFRFDTAPNGATNRDTITDYNVAADTIHLENAIFTSLGAAGTLSAQFFRIGTAAADSNDYIIYNQATGVLSYDADGSGVASAVQFATLSSGLALTNADFVVI